MALKTLKGDVLEGWHRQVTNNGVPYYISTSLETSQWYHPEYVQLLQETIKSSRNIKYAAYRTASKLQFFSNTLELSKRSLQSMVSACATVGLSSNDCNDDHITVEVLTALLEGLFGVEESGVLSSNSQPQTDEVVQATSSPDATVCIEMLINLILNLFDQSREGLLPVLGVKIVLIVLCDESIPLTSKHTYLFNQLSDYNAAVTRNSMRGGLQALARLVEVMGEELWFGRHLVEAALDSCFGKDKGNMVGVSDSELRQWLAKDPQTLVWWSTLYRLSHSSSVVHTGTVCSQCLTGNPKGMLYVCLQCVNYTLCQHCFFRGLHCPPHLSSHPLQEYCTQSSIKEKSKEVINKLSERLKAKNRPSKTQQRYLPINTQESEIEPDNCQSNDKSLSTRTVSMCEENIQNKLNNGEQKNKKKSLVEILFRTKRKENKENIEMREESNFKRMDSRSRSFGSRRANYNVLQETNKFNGRYGSCRMTKPVTSVDTEEGTKTVGKQCQLNESYVKALEHNRNNSLRSRQNNKSSTSVNSPSTNGLGISSIREYKECLEVKDTKEGLEYKSTNKGLEAKGTNEDFESKDAKDSLPRGHLEKMIAQMQRDHKALMDLTVVKDSEGSSSEVLQQHSKQLLQHIDTLRGLVGGNVGVVAPLVRPEKLPQNVMSASTPISGASHPSQRIGFQSTPIVQRDSRAPDGGLRKVPVTPGNKLLKQACLSSMGVRPRVSQLNASLSPIPCGGRDDTQKTVMAPPQFVTLPRRRIIRPFDSPNEDSDSNNFGTVPRKSNTYMVEASPVSDSSPSDGYSTKCDSDLSTTQQIDSTFGESSACASFTVSHRANTFSTKSQVNSSSVNHSEQNTLGNSDSSCQMKRTSEVKYSDSRSEVNNSDSRNTNEPNYSTRYDSNSNEPNYSRSYDSNSNEPNYSTRYDSNTNEPNYITRYDSIAEPNDSTQYDSHLFDVDQKMKDIMKELDALLVSSSLKLSSTTNAEYSSVGASLKEISECVTDFAQTLQPLENGTSTCSDAGLSST